MNYNLKKLEKFFNYDLKVKKIMYESSFKDNNAYTKDNTSLIEYKDLLFKNLQELEYYIINSLKMFNYDEDTIETIQNKFNIYKQILIDCKTESKYLKSFYQAIFSDMNEGLIKEISENCYGYYLFNDRDIIKKATTINEMLHCIHHSITNDEYYYQSISEINKKYNNNKSEITLSGKENKLAEQIYNSIPLELDCGITNIIGLNNKVLIMIRELGHALTIEITEEESNITIDYFIPKICNVEMVNKLKGVTKVTEEDNYTIGKFNTTEENLSNELINFISMVPTDSDMINHLKR